jgi:hypothetical protein
MRPHKGLRKASWGRGGGRGLSLFFPLTLGPSPTGPGRGPRQGWRSHPVGLGLDGVARPHTLLVGVSGKGRGGQRPPISPTLPLFQGPYRPF